MTRSTMADIINELRSLTDASTNDYTINSTPYWLDDQLQNVLDVNRQDYIFFPLQMYPTQVSGGSLSYREYRANQSFWEQTSGGTDIFYLQDSTGATVGTSLYSVDYRRGVVTFGADQRGSVYYLTGRSYDLQSAAADVWRKKAAHYAPTAFNFSTDNHSINREQIYKHCLEMADYFDGKSIESVQTVQMWRSDVC